MKRLQKIFKTGPRRMLQSSILPPCFAGGQLLFMRKALTILVLVCTVVLFFAGAASAAPNRLKDTGILTAVEKNGPITIESSGSAVDEKGNVKVDSNGYLMDSTARIIDSSGNRCSLNEITLPTRVYFEYVNTNQGPVIKMLQVQPQ
jgi:hypothetical protein